jgi:hypothetical protein
MLVLLTPLCRARLGRSTLSGTLTDPDGARIPGATVTATQSATGLERKTETSAQGTYALDSLPSGSYTIVFVQPGFSRARFEQVARGQRG